MTQAPGNLPNNRSDFVSTAATPAAMVYNRALDVIYVSNPAWNRIDIISNATHKLLQSVPVRGPSGMDASQDGSTLWIGTQSQQIYAMNTTSFALNTYMAPPLSGVYSNQTSPYKWQDTQLFALANDTLLLSVTPQPGSGINYVAIWNPSTNALTNVPATSSYYFNLRSGDHTKAYGWSANSVNCQVMVYDSTVQQTSTFPTLNEPCSFSAVNYNGTRFVGENNSHWALYDGSFQLIGNLPTSLTSTGISFYGGWVFSPDGSTLYQIGSNFGTSGAYIQTFDVASLTLKGTAPPFRHRVSARLSTSTRMGFCLAFRILASASTTARSSRRILPTLSVRRGPFYSPQERAHWVAERARLPMGFMTSLPMSGMGQTEAVRVWTPRIH